MPVMRTWAPEMVTGFISPGAPLKRVPLEFHTPATVRRLEPVPPSMARMPQVWPTPFCQLPVVSPGMVTW